MWIRSEDASSVGEIRIYSVDAIVSDSLLRKDFFDTLVISICDHHKPEPLNPTSTRVSPAHLASRLRKNQALNAWSWLILFACFPIRQESFQQQVLFQHPFALALGVTILFIMLHFTSKNNWIHKCVRYAFLCEMRLELDQAYFKSDFQFANAA